MAAANIVVVGAGVAGLTTALLLSKNPKYKIMVAAKYMPGDYNAAEYASPWAGANYLPVSAEGTAAAKHDRETWPELEKLARLHPEAGVHFQETNVFKRTKDNQSSTGVYLADKIRANPWWMDVVLNFREIPTDQLAPGMDSGTAFTTVDINTAIYLPYLVGECLKAGVIFRRAVFKHIREAADVHLSGSKADLVVNCTGMSALRLGGVEDKKMTPVRGQTVLVRDVPSIGGGSSGTDDGDDEICYVIQRAAGGGTILGGCYQKGNWDVEVDPNLAIRIMKRTVELFPALTQGKGIEHLSVIRHSVGLRPLREGGVRLEKEKIDGVWTVHNYGHGGFGYQSSYGCSKVAVKLVEEALSPTAKL